jgi:ectoine hydroxylase-related dioxygenase (phytanoyl-CoA dioxygenase family)
MATTVVYSGPNDLLERVDRDGCFVIRGFFDRAAVVEARREVEAVFDADERRRAAGNVPANDQSTRLRSIYVPLMHTMWFMSLRSPAFCRLVNDAFASPTIKDFIRDLAGSFRLRIDLARRSSGKNDYVDDFQVPHEWHRDTPGEFTFGIFLDDLTTPRSGGTTCIRGSHHDVCDPRWDLMIGAGVNKTRVEYLNDRARRDLPAAFSTRAPLNAQVREVSRPQVYEMLGEMGDLYFFLNETWHGRAPNTTGKRFMLARIGGFASDFPFKDDIPLPTQIDTLPDPLRAMYDRNPRRHGQPSTYLQRLYAAPRLRELTQAAKREKNALIPEMLAGRS